MCIKWVIAFWVMCGTAAAQQSVDPFAAVLNQERIILQHNKPYYLANDRVWYSVHLIGEAQKNAQSKVVYVSLTGSKGDVLLSQRILVNDGQAAGEFEIPQSASSGYYELTASTMWAQNFGSSQHFTKRLLILNSSEVPRGESSSDSVHVAFYPEGRAFVTDFESKIVVEVKVGHTLAPNVQVIVYNEKNAAISAAETDFNGIAQLSFTPISGQKYFAEIITKGNNKKRFVLPTPETNALSLQLLQQNEHELVIGVGNRASKACQLIVIQKGKVVYRHPVQGTTTIHLKKDILSAGLAQVFILDMLGRASNQRYISIEKTAPVKVNIETDKPIYGPRDKVNVKVDIRDVAGGGLQGYFNVSVFALHPKLKQSDDLLLILPLDSQLIKSFVNGKKRRTIEPEVWISPLTADEGKNFSYRQSSNWSPLAGVDVLSLSSPFNVFLRDDLKRRQIEASYGISYAPADAQIPKLIADKVYYMDDYVQVESMEYFLKHVISNLKLSKQKDKYNLSILYTDKTSKKYFFKETPLILVDGVVATRPEDLLNIPLTDVNSVELLWGEATLADTNIGDKALNGILAVYTKSGEAGVALKRNGADYLFKQFHRPASFVLNNYEQTETQMPDFRTQLFWAPRIATKDAKAGLSFYTSDELGDFIILVQGVTEDGIEFSGEATISVNLRR